MGREAPSGGLESRSGAHRGRIAAFWSLFSADREEQLVLEIRKNDMTAAGAPGPLVDLVRNHFDQVLDVRIQYWKQNRYLPSGMSVGVQKRAELEALATVEIAEDATDESPEEIAAAVYDLAVEHAQSEGASRYRACLFGRKKGGTVDQLDSVVFSVGIDYETGVVGDASDAGPVDVLDLAHTIAKDTHGRHMKTLDKLEALMTKTVDLVGQVAELAGPMAQAKVDLRKLDLEIETERMEHADREDFRRHGFDFLGKLSQVFGVQLAKAWRESGMPGAPPKASANEDVESEEAPAERVEQIDSLVSRWDAIFADLGPDKLQELSDLLGADLGTLAERMTTAKDDEMFRNQARTLVERAQQDPEWPVKLVKIGGPDGILTPAQGKAFTEILHEAAA